MSLRPLLAGPSARPAQSHLRTFARNFTIPHPDVVPAPGTSTSFVIRTAKRPPSLPHIYAVVRAAEKALGSSIISVDVSRNQDTLQPWGLIHIQTLYPVPYDKVLHMSTAAPKVSSDIFGGPSLDEVRSALRNESREPIGGEEELAFKIEKALRAEKAQSRSGRRERVRLTKGVPPTVEAVNVLEGMGGKWAEIAEKYSYLRSAEEARWTAGNRRAGDKHASGRKAGGLDGDKAQVDDVEQAEAKAERRETKHRRHDSDEKRKVREDEDNPIARSRKHSEEARELRHRQRADQLAGRGDREQESDWTFDLDKAPTPNETDVDLDALKLHPEPPAAAPDSETGSASLSDLQTTPKPRGFSVRRQVSPATPESPSTPASSPAAAQIPDSAPAQLEASGSTAPASQIKVQRDRATAAKAQNKAKDLAGTKRVMDQLRRDAQAREARLSAEADRAVQAQKDQEEKERLAKEEATKEAEAVAAAGQAEKTEEQAAYDQAVADQKRYREEWKHVEGTGEGASKGKSWWPFSKKE